MINTKSNTCDLEKAALFSEISLLSKVNQSYDFSIGVPDFNADPLLLKFLKKATKVDTQSYEFLSGNPELVKKIITYNAQRPHPLFLRESEVNVVPCATFALYTSMKVLLQKNDEVIVFQPYYYTYIPAITLNGGIPIFCNLSEDFSIDWQLLKDKISSKTKAIIINTPQNPTGKIWTFSDFEQLYELIKNTNITIVSEEIYDTYCYDGRSHYSAFCHPALKEKTISIFSFGKMFHTSGWKVSYLLASADFLVKFKNIQQYISYSTNLPCQHAISDYLPYYDVEKIRKRLENKRNLFLNLLKDTPFELAMVPEGGFYMLLNFRKIDNKKTDIEFAKWLTKEKRVACLPLSAFYHNKNNTDFVRFSFAKKQATIIEGLSILQKL